MSHKDAIAEWAIRARPVVPGVGIACCFLGWVGALVGPSALSALGMAGFAVAFLSWPLSRAQAPPLGAIAGGAANAERWRFKLEGLMVLVVCLALLTGFIALIQPGVTEPGPVLATRVSYALNSHGALTQVSRSDYIIAGVSFATCWHAVALMANLVALYRWVYGEDPFRRAVDRPRRR